MSLGVALALGGATLGAGLLSSAGQMYSNRVNSATQLAINDQNAQLQYDINNAQIQAAQMNNQTAIDLANTAHQREVLDLRDANLNPILSANGNGSAVPSLDTPGLEAPDMQAPQISNPMTGLADSVGRLSSAVQAADQHELNEARIASTGLTSPDVRREIGATNTAKVRAEALASRERAEYELEKAANDRHEEALRTRVLDELVGEGYSVGDSEAYKLSKEAYISALKMKANENFRAGISSAKQVSDAVSGFVPLFKKAPTVNRFNNTYFNN